MTQSVYLDLEPTTAPGLPYNGPCRHGRADVGKPQVLGNATIASVLCLECGTEWKRCAIVGARMLPGERK